MRLRLLANTKSKTEYERVGWRLLAFCIMDIVTAFKYRECGYRIRRTAWVTGMYLDHHNFTYIKLFAEDVLCDDWEIITEGIVKDFPITYSD